MAYNVYTLLNVVSYYDLSVLFMSVMGVQKKVWMGVGGWGELYPSFFGILLTLQSPLSSKGVSGDVTQRKQLSKKVVFLDNKTQRL